VTQAAANGIVARDAFEASLAALERSCENPLQGLFGPSSAMWLVLRESGVFLGAGAALLLQIAHPYVAHAITDHSRALRDPVGRFHRTFSPIFTMIFGTRDDALAAARRVRRVHDAINGPLGDGGRYDAHDANALLWVHLTLWHTAIHVYEEVIGPLAQARKDQFQSEANRFAMLFGIPAELHDATFAAFEARFERIVNSDLLCVTPQARIIGDYFIGAGRGAFGRYLPAWYRAMTAQLLPARLADGFALAPDPPAAQAGWRRCAAWIRRMPAALRYVSPYHEAAARLSGRAPSLLTRTMNRAWLGRPSLGTAL